jgi:membrane protein
MPNPFSSVIEKAKATVGRVRRASPPLDHLFQTGSRYNADQGNVHAAAITYYSFLSLFPLLLLATSVLGFVLHGHPSLLHQVQNNVKNNFPGAGSLLVSSINGAVQHRTTTGIVGLLGLLYGGLGWIDNLRTGLRTVWHQKVSAGNIVATKTADLIALVGLGIVMLLSVAITGVGGGLTSKTVKWLGLQGVTGMGIVTRVVSIAFAIAADVLIFFWVFIRLGKLDRPRRPVVKGAVFAAVGFELLKVLGSAYILRTTSHARAAYGLFGIVIGMLVWMNLVARWVLFSAVWIVTAPYDDDVAPSGTADEQTAREAEVPVEFADDDSPKARQVEDAPAPLTPALEGKPGVGFGEGAEDAGRSGRSGRS